MPFEYSECEAFIKKLRSAKQDFNKMLPGFLEGIGLEFLRIVQDEIIRRKVMDTRLLLASFQHGDENNLWEMSEGDLTLEVGTNVTYASHVNSGHYTNPSGVATRFVPGVWEGDRFTYIPGAKTGMVLKQKWVPGKHYWENALRILERMLPALLEEKLEDWMIEYFEEFL